MFNSQATAMSLPEHIMAWTGRSI